MRNEKRVHLPLIGSKGQGNSVNSGRETARRDVFTLDGDVKGETLSSLGSVSLESLEVDKKLDCSRRLQKLLGRTPVVSSREQVVSRTSTAPETPVSFYYREEQGVRRRKQYWRWRAIVANGDEESGEGSHRRRPTREKCKVSELIPCG